MSNSHKNSAIIKKLKINDTDPPVFIIGNPRSGTTLLRLMLTNHPSVVIAPEGGFMMWLYPEFRDADFSQSHVRNHFIEAVAESRKFEFWCISVDQLQDIFNQLSPKNYSDACRTVYLAYARSTGKNCRIWGDKNNYYLNHIDDIHDLFPDVRFVHIIRDGRDVAASYIEVSRRKHESKYQPVLPTAIRDIAAEWTSNITTIRKSFARLPAGSVCEIRYEDLVSGTESVLSSLCRFLGIEYDSAMLEYHSVTATQFREPASYSTWKARNELPVDDSKVNNYKRTLSAQEVEDFEEIADNILLKYGYKLQSK